MQVLENDKFKVEIDELGAQLTHLYNKKENFDYIWNGKLWPKHAPVLFPAIGRSVNDKYLIDGTKYDMPQHGFAGEQIFTVKKNTGKVLVLDLIANEETKKMFPFDFKLTIMFELGEQGLSYHFSVLNQESDREFSFSLGSHPAFNVPINGEGKFTDYTLKFEPSDLELKQFEIVKTPNPYRTGKVVTLSAADAGLINLNYDMFEDGLVIIENDGLKGVTLSSQNTDHQVHLSLADFRYVCLWTKEGVQAPFLCIEPFAGLPDVVDQPSELMEKEANTRLAPGQIKNFEYAITLQ